MPRKPPLAPDRLDWRKLRAELDAKQVRIVARDLPTSWQLAAPGDEFTSRMFAAINAMLLDMLAAVARKDYEDRRRRQAQGQAGAKAEGKYRGRPEDTARNKGIAAMLTGRCVMVCHPGRNRMLAGDCRQDREARRSVLIRRAKGMVGRARLAQPHQTREKKSVTLIMDAIRLIVAPVRRVANSRVFQVALVIATILSLDHYSYDYTSAPPDCLRSEGFGYCDGAVMFRVLSGGYPDRSGTASRTDDRLCVHSLFCRVFFVAPGDEAYCVVPGSPTFSVVGTVAA